MGSLHGVGAVVRALASHQCVPGSIPGPAVICGLGLLLVLYSAPRGFSPDTPVFPSHQKPTLLNSNSIWKQWMKSHLVEMPLQIPITIIITWPMKCSGTHKELPLGSCRRSRKRWNNRKVWTKRYISKNLTLGARVFVRSRRNVPQIWTILSFLDELKVTRSSSRPSAIL